MLAFYQYDDVTIKVIDQAADFKVVASKNNQVFKEVWTSRWTDNEAGSIHNAIARMTQELNIDLDINSIVTV